MRTALLSAACLLAAPLAAQDPTPWARPAYGATLGVATAEADFRNVVGGKVGLELGLAARYAIFEHLAVRPLIEYAHFSPVVNGYVYKSTRYNDLGSELKLLVPVSL